MDVEQGWTLNHEDLASAGITLISGQNRAYPGHGTAVLGEVLAVDNTRGGVGIAPSATGRVVSQWRTGTTYSTAAAILSAADNMTAGDVMLIEAQTTVGGSTFLPVETEQAAFDAIRHATDNGIVVVEAGGNGSNDLDSFTDAAGRNILDRSSADFTDSGAIMVGAASSTAPHSRLSFSNFGSRIDCFAWGENIDTTGDGWTGTGTTTYTTGFGGTSGASPIIAGAALLLQSCLVQQGKGRLNPLDMRSNLSDAAHNTPSANPATDRIGVMPNLRALIEFQARFPSLKGIGDRYVSLVHILIGIIDDSPGYIWVPGKGPVPVDPDWAGRRVRLSKAKRDMIAALAIGELASRLADPVARELHAAASSRTVARLAKQIGRENAGR